MTGWPWSKRNEDDPEMDAAREEMEDFINIVRRDPFAVFRDDDDIEENPAFEEYEDEVEDARFTAYAMMSDLDEMEAEEDADEMDGGGFDGGMWEE